ncbi:MAG: 3-oxoacyl-ACP synthase [Cyclobacteriaceae bacterium]
MKKVKQQLYAFCCQWVDKKIDLAVASIKSAQDSANEETKSSAGDKYETGRAMAQLEIEKNSIQLAEANKLKKSLSEFNEDTSADFVRLGSLVKTDKGWFYLSLSAGSTKIEETSYICLSPASPLGSAMMGLKKGGSFSFNKVNYLIQGIF